jgi:malonate transporter MadL subunit
VIVYGVALLALCTLTGLWLGEVLGRLLGVSANVGGVGIAMVLLLLVAGRLRSLRLLPEATEQGIVF